VSVGIANSGITIVSIANVGVVDVVTAGGGVADIGVAVVGVADVMMLWWLTWFHPQLLQFSVAF